MGRKSFKVSANHHTKTNARNVKRNRKNNTGSVLKYYRKKEKSERKKRKAIFKKYLENITIILVIFIFLFLMCYFSM